MTYRVTFWLSKWGVGLVVVVSAADHRAAEERARGQARSFLARDVQADLDTAAVEFETVDVVGRC